MVQPGLVINQNPMLAIWLRSYQLALKWSETFSVPSPEPNMNPLSRCHVNT